MNFSHAKSYEGNQIILSKEKEIELLFSGEEELLLKEFFFPLSSHQVGRDGQEQSPRRRSSR